MAGNLKKRIRVKIMKKMVLFLMCMCMLAFSACKNNFSDKAKDETSGPSPSAPGDNSYEGEIDWN